MSKRGHKPFPDFEFHYWDEEGFLSHWPEIPPNCEIIIESTARPPGVDPIREAYKAAKAQHERLLDWLELDKE